MHHQKISSIINESIKVKQALMGDIYLIAQIDTVVKVITTAFQNGNSVYFAGNGGSAADAQHLAAEFGEFSKSILEKLTENEAVGLTEFVRRVLNLYQESDAGFNMQVEMIKWNNEKAGVYIDNYGKAAKM